MSDISKRVQRMARGRSKRHAHGAVHDAFRRHGYPGNREIQPAISSKMSDMPKIIPVSNNIKGPELHRTVDRTIDRLLPGNIAVRNCVSIAVRDNQSELARTEQFVNDFMLWTQMHPSRLSELDPKDRHGTAKIPREIELFSEPLVLPEETQSIAEYIVEHTPVTGTRMPGNIIAIVSLDHLKKM